MTQNIDQSRLRNPSTQANATTFKFTAGTATVLLVWSILCFCIALFGLYHLVFDPGPGSIGIAAVAALLATTGFFAFRSSHRFRDTVAVNADGIWYLSRRRGESTYIAWSEVATVDAFDTQQRLLLRDASASRRIRLEYQLKDFSKLRDFVLSHATSCQKPNGPSPSLFHRTWIYKCILLCGAGFCFLYAHFAEGQIVPAAIAIGFGVACLALLAQDPTTVEITKAAVVIAYPGWKRTIDLRSITTISFKDIHDVKGNVWAAVIVNHPNGRPIKLLRFREGSVVLHNALKSAWNAAGASSQLVNS
jgi:hypothetical protein